MGEERTTGTSSSHYLRERAWLGRMLHAPPMNCECVTTSVQPTVDSPIDYIYSTCTDANCVAIKGRATKDANLNFYGLPLPLPPTRWRPDPQAPFQTPSHLKEAVQEFERSQVPSMGLRPNTIPSDAQPLDQSSEDLEFIYSYVHTLHQCTVYRVVHTSHLMFKQMVGWLFS